MDISALKYFIVTARTEHMNQAAQLLNITQPSLSASIKRLEAELGFPLFDRRGRGIQLNEYGRIFLEGVTAAEAIMDQCITQIQAVQNASKELVRLACSNSPTNSRLMDLLLSAGMNLKLENIPADWGQELLSKSCDLVITMGRLHHSHIKSVILKNQQLVLVTSREHPLACLESVPLHALHQYSFCSTDAPHSLIHVLQESFPDYGFHPRITFLGRSSADMLKAIRSGRYVGLMVKRNLPPDQELCILNTENFSFSLPLYLYWREQGAASPSLEKVRQSIIDFYAALPEDL